MVEFGDGIPKGTEESVLSIGARLQPKNGRLNPGQKKNKKEVE